MNCNNKGFKYSIALCEEKVSYWTPIVFRGEFTDRIKAAKDIGYDAVELHLSDVGKIDLSKIKKCLEDCNIRVSALGTGPIYSIGKLSLIDPDEEVRNQAINRLKEHIDLAKQLDCIVILGSVRGNIPDYTKYDIYESYFINGLEEIVEYAEKSKVPLVLEAINRYVNNYLNTVQEVLDVINKIDSPMLKIHIDTHHLNIEEKDMKQSIISCGEKLGYVHVSDSNLKYPGSGHIDFKNVLCSLKEIGYKGYISLECLPYPKDYEVATKSLALLKSLE